MALGNNATATARAHEEDDEVTIVLRHFRPKAEFVGWDRVDRRERRGIGRGVGGVRKRPLDRGYSSIRYVRGERKLRLSYQHYSMGQPSGCIAFLRFDVSVDDPAVVTCVYCNGPDKSGNLRQFVDGLCRNISAAGDLSSTSTNGASSNASLFSVVSRLLQALNRELPRIAESGSDNHSTVLWREISYLSGLNSAAARSILGLEMLLLRSAAAGRNRAALCSPIPVEYSSATGGDADAIANCIFESTDRMDSAVNAASKEHICLLDLLNHQEQALLSFLFSLPWTEGKLEVGPDPFSGTDTSTPTIPDDSSGNLKRSLATIHLCLDTATALGDESPKFKCLANRHGVVKAYHGTKIENAWSILNFGLQNLSYHSTLSANGAMMGTGVYLSTSYDVAAFFAKNDARYTPALLQAWQHPAVLRLILSTLSESHAYINKSTHSACSFWHEYTVSCYPVFEATIIAPPDEDTDCKGEKHCTRREGKYYVVPNSDNIRITKLYLTIELKKRSTVGLRWLPFFIVLCMTLWMLSRLSREVQEDKENYY